MPCESRGKVRSVIRTRLVKVRPENVEKLPKEFGGREVKLCGRVGREFARWARAATD